MNRKKRKIKRQLQGKPGAATLRRTFATEFRWAMHPTKRRSSWNANHPWQRPRKYGKCKSCKTPGLLTLDQHDFLYVFVTKSHVYRMRTHKLSPEIIEQVFDGEFLSWESTIRTSLKSLSELGLLEHILHISILQGTHTLKNIRQQNIIPLPVAPSSSKFKI